MEPLEFRDVALSELENVFSDILERHPNHRIFLFEGDLGAGKTTLIKAGCKLLGISDSVHSPTFSIVNEYRMPGGAPVYHFDFYRLSKPSEALDIGVEEYFCSGSYCFVEWPGNAGNIIPQSAVTVTLSGNGSTRTIKVH